MLFETVFAPSIFLAICPRATGSLYVKSPSVLYKINRNCLMLTKRIYIP